MATTTKGKKSIPKPSEPIPAPTAPGEILLEEWLVPLGMSQTALAAKMGVHVQVVNGIINRRRAVTALTALLLARALDTTPEFWMNAQVACDLWVENQKLERKQAHPRKRPSVRRRVGPATTTRRAPRLGRAV